MHKIFVYGTLKDKTAPTYVKETTVQGLTLYAVSPHFPGAVFAPGEVRGEIHEVTSQQLEALDSYEGVPGLYLREMVKTVDGEEVWVYVWNRSIEGCEHIGSVWHRTFKNL